MSKRVLLVDDNLGVRTMLRTILTSEGYEVVEAGDGLDGLTKAKKEAFDVFLIDYKMPIMNGITLLKRLKEIPQYTQTQMVLLTTDNGAEFESEVAQFDHINILYKPISQAQLLDMLSQQSQMTAA